MRSQTDIIAVFGWFEVRNISLVQSLQRSIRSLVLAYLIQERDKTFILLAIYLFEFYCKITRLFQGIAAEEIWRIVILTQQLLFLGCNHWSQLMQVAYHQELHTTERQIMPLAILAQYGVYGIEQIAAHHTDFIDYQQVNTADDITLEFAELIAFLFAPTESCTRNVRREWKLEERMNGHSSGIDGSDACRSQHYHSFRRQFFQLLEEGCLTRTRLSRQEEVGTRLFYDIPCQDGFFIHFHFASIFILDFFYYLAHVLALLLGMRTIFCNMPDRNNNYGLVALTREKLLHLIGIVIAYPAGS